MDILDLVQLPCIKCQNSINQLINEQQQSQLICDSCLQQQTKKYIRLNLQIDKYQNKIKQISLNPSTYQQHYENGFGSLEKRNYEENVADVQDMNAELSHIQSQIASQQMKSAKLYQQLIMLEEQQNKKLAEYHQQQVELDKLHQSIAEEQYFIMDLQLKEEQIKQCSQFIEQYLKR